MQSLPEQLRPSTTDVTSVSAAWHPDVGALPGNMPTNYEPDDQDTLLESGRHVIGLARRHWFVVMASVAAAVLFAFFVIHRSVPLYRAKAVIRLQNKTQQMAGGLGVATGSDMLGRSADPILSQVQVLESRERRGLTAAESHEGFPLGRARQCASGRSCTPGHARPALLGNRCRRGRGIA